VATDDRGKGSHPRALDRIRRQERGLWVNFVEILDYRRRLHEHFAAVERKRWHAALRIDRAILRRMLLAAILGQMDENLFGGDAFQVKRDAQPIGGGRAEVGVKFHDGSRQRRWTSVPGILAAALAGCDLGGQLG